MYLDYFSLERHPFRITPDTSLFYSGDSRGRGVVLDALVFAIENGEGILKVVGEVGSGKTMLCRMLEERLPESTEIVYLANPNLSPDEILYAVAFELKLPVRRDTSRLLVMQILQDYLLKQHGLNRKVLITIEEAQSMPFETLEEIRLFSNLETHRDKLIQIIMFGQPELDENLSTRKIRQLRERITHSFYLHPLTTKEAAEYIRFRLGAAGCPCPKLLTAQASRLIARASGGLTRRLNILADKALIAAYADDALGSNEQVHEYTAPMVTWKHAYAAIRDSDYPFFPWQTIFTPLRVISASIALVAIATAFSLWPNGNSIVNQLLAYNKVLGSPAAGLSSINKLVSKPQSQPIPVANANEAISSENKPNNLQNSSVPVSAAISWLANTGGSGYTVQFVSGETGQLKSAESFLTILDEAGLIEESYMCMTTTSNTSYWAIKFGTFPGVSLAQQFVDKLPTVIQDYKPYVQDLSSVECNTNTAIAALILE